MKIRSHTPLIESHVRQLNSEPQVIANALSPNEIEWLLTTEKSCERVEKLNGIINHKYAKKSPVEKFIEEKIYPYFGKLVRHGGSFFQTPCAFHAHTDTGKSEEMNDRLFPFKNILIPLVSSTQETPLYTVFFKQRNLGQASHFWRAKKFGDNNPIYNFKVTDYSGLLNLEDGDFNETDHKKHLSHLPIECLHGLSIESVLHWKIGDIICFDCSMLHASNNFERFGVIKHGLSYFGSKEI